MPDEGSFSEYRKLIMSELTRLNANVEKIEAQYLEYLLKSSLEINRLKFWAALYGAIGGGIMTVIVKEAMERW